ncbi:MAG: hypothetical protein ABIH25_03740 [Candidatus Woesearchaeota archaeon]
MEEEIKINFSRPMLVLKIRDVYKAPYHKNKYVIIKQKDCESVVDFKKKLHEYTGNWSSGLYDLQFVLKEGTYLQPTIYSTLIRIEIRSGRVAKVWKASPYSKKEYPIWLHLKKYHKKKPKVTKKAKPKKKKKPKKPKLAKKLANKPKKSKKKKVISKKNLPKKHKKEN